MAEEAARPAWNRGGCCGCRTPSIPMRSLRAAAAGSRRLRARLGFPPKRAVVIFTGRLAPEKELFSLLGAFAAVAQRHAGCASDFAGRWAQPPRISKSAPGNWAWRTACGSRGGSRPAAFPTGSRQRPFHPGLLQRRFPVFAGGSHVGGVGFRGQDIPGNAQLIDPGRPRPARSGGRRSRHRGSHFEAAWRSGVPCADGRRGPPARGRELFHGQVSGPVRSAVRRGPPGRASKVTNDQAGC